MMPRPVVVGYDGSEAARRAVERAAELAGADGRVVLVTAVPATDALELEHVAGRAATPRAREGLLDEAAELLAGRRDLQVEKRAASAEPADALVETARELDAGLIVVGARGDSYPARALRGSVGETLVARSPCDLLVVR